MNFKRITSLIVAAAVAFTSVAFTSFAANTDDGWTNTDDTWTYTADSDKDWFSLDLMEIATSKNVNWANVKYISATVSTEGTACIGIDVNYTGEETDDAWIGCDSKYIDNGEATVYFNMNGDDPTWINLSFRDDDGDGVALAGSQAVTVTDITFSTEERDYTGVTGEWYEKDGAWHYTHGEDTSAYPPSLNLAPLKPEDTNWSDVKYVSADVTVDKTANVVIGGNLTGIEDDWANGTSKIISDGNTETLYLETNGAETPEYIDLSFWAVDYENNYIIDEGTVVTVSNITFSKEERDYTGVTGEWYQQNGAWHYTHGEDTENTPAPLNLMNLKPNNLDWGDVKYVSVTLTADNDTIPVICGNLTGEGDDYTDGTEKYLTGGETITVYRETNGAEVYGLDLSFWHVDWDNSFGVKAGTKVTVTDVTFSKEARDYSNVYDEWYPVEGGWEYKDSGKGGDLPEFSLSSNTEVDWANLKYASAKVEVDGTVFASLRLNGDDTSKGGAGMPVTDGEELLLVFDYVGGWSSLCVSGCDMTPNTKITVTDINYSTTDFANPKSVVGQWVQTGEDSYYFYSGGLSKSYSELPVRPDNFDMGAVNTVSMKIKYVAGANATNQTATISVCGERINDEGEEEWTAGYNFVPSTIERVIERTYRGCIEKNPRLTANLYGPDMEIFVSELTLDTTPVSMPVMGPNDLLIDEDWSFIESEGSQHNVMWTDLSKIEVPGTIRFEVKLLDGYDAHEVNAIWNEWTWLETGGSEEDGWNPIFSAPKKFTEDGICEVKVTKSDIEMIQDWANHRCELVINGMGVEVGNFIFSPTPNTPKPKAEEVKPETLPEEEKEKLEEELEESKDNTVTEEEAPGKVTNGKTQGHKENKKNTKNEDVYSLRIVQMVEKEELKHAESVSITVYSKKADQYITLTADTVFSFLNINGEKVKAGGNHAFLTVIIDNVPADDEITFSNYTINYKK